MNEFGLVPARRKVEWKAKFTFGPDGIHPLTDCSDCGEPKGIGHKPTCKFVKNPPKPDTI